MAARPNLVLVLSIPGGLAVRVGKMVTTPLVTVYFNFFNTSFVIQLSCPFTLIPSLEIRRSGPKFSLLYDCSGQ